MDGFAFQVVATIEAEDRFILLTYTIMALFKQKVMKPSAECRRKLFLELFFVQMERLKAPFKLAIS